MLSGILCPAFLQAAGRSGKSKEGKITLVFNENDPIITSLSAKGGEGTTIIKSIKNGEKIIATYTDLGGDEISVQADANTKIEITGSIGGDFELYEKSGLISVVIENIESGLDGINFYNCSNLSTVLISNTPIRNIEMDDCVSIIDLDLSGDSTLHYLSISGCAQLKTLNLKSNTLLQSCNLDNCNKIETIYYPANYDSVSDAVANAITNADSNNGTVYTDSQGDYYSTIADAATAKGWTIEQL